MPTTLLEPRGRFPDCNPTQRWHPRTLPTPSHPWCRRTALPPAIAATYVITTASPRNSPQPIAFSGDDHCRILFSGTERSEFSGKPAGRSPLQRNVRGMPAKAAHAIRLRRRLIASTVPATKYHQNAETAAKTTSWPSHGEFCVISNPTRHSGLNARNGSRRKPPPPQASTARISALGTKPPKNTAQRRFMFVPRTT